MPQTYNEYAIAFFKQAVTDGAQSATSVSRIPSSAATTNATLVKNSPGKVFTVNGFNSTATVTYLKFYNSASLPVVGTTPVFLTYVIPANAAFTYDVNTSFSVGIGYGLTTDAADAGTTAPAAGAILGLNVTYA